MQIGDRRTISRRGVGGALLALLATPWTLVAAQGYPPGPNLPPSGYPAPPSGYPPQQPGYPAPSGYPPQQPGYPSPPSGNPGYPTAPGGTAAPQGAYGGAPMQGPQGLDELMAWERQDMGVAATRTLHGGAMHGATPNQIPGGQVITTKGLVALLQNPQGVQPLVFDVLGAPQQLPNALPAVPASQPGSFSDQTQQQFGQWLQQVTRGSRDTPLVFYCQGPQCWMSYNASLRAINLGYRNVLWYRGGLEAWQRAGLPVTGGQQGPAPPGNPSGPPGGYPGAGAAAGPYQPPGGLSGGPGGGGYPPQGPYPPAGGSPGGYPGGPPGGYPGGQPGGYPGGQPGGLSLTGAWRDGAIPGGGRGATRSPPGVCAPQQHVDIKALRL